MVFPLGYQLPSTRLLLFTFQVREVLVSILSELLSLVKGVLSAFFYGFALPGPRFLHLLVSYLMKE